MEIWPEPVSSRPKNLLTGGSRVGSQRLLSVPQRKQDQQPADLGDAVEDRLLVALQLPHLVGSEFARKGAGPMLCSLQLPIELLEAPMQPDMLERETVEIERISNHRR